MAYERIKTINKRQYRYLVEGKREDNKVRQKVLKYLGPVVPVRKKRKKKEETKLATEPADIETLSDEESYLLMVALMYKKKYNKIPLSRVIKVVNESIRKNLDKEPPQYWEETIDTFKTRNWITIKKGDIYFLLTKKQQEKMEELLLEKPLFTFPYGIPIKKPKRKKKEKPDLKEIIEKTTHPYN